MFINLMSLELVEDISLKVEEFTKSLSQNDSLVHALLFLVLQLRNTIAKPRSSWLSSLERRGGEGAEEVVTTYVRIYTYICDSNRLLFVAEIIFPLLCCLGEIAIASS